MGSVSFRHADVLCLCLVRILWQSSMRYHMEEPYSRTGLMTALYVAMSVSFCFPHDVAVSTLIIFRGLCACSEML